MIFWSKGPKPFDRTYICDAGAALREFARKFP